MARPSRRFATLVCLAVLGIALAVSVELLLARRDGGRTTQDPIRSEEATVSAALRFIPATYTFGETPVFTGDSVRFVTAVENASASPITLSSIPKTCGCMTFGEGGDLKLPATLAPGERFPFQVEISTTNKAGTQRLQLVADGSTAAGDPIRSDPSRWRSGAGSGPRS
jgi:hypothetical protein